MKTPFPSLLVFTMCAAAWSRPCLSSAAESAPGKRPNIVFILADDLGWTDLGVQGSGYYESPHIDRLAAQGIRLTNYHQCQNCAPTRAALMSGQYAPRTGVYTVGSIERFNWRSRSLRPVDNVENLPLERITVAQSLKAAGYTTAIFGKWHLGQQGDYHPSQRGFDEAITTMGKHFDFVTQPKVDYPPGVYLADWLTDRAVDFIERHKDRPFFLYLTHFAVHSPHDAKRELGVLRGPSAGTLQPPGRSRRAVEPGRPDAGEGQGVARPTRRLAPIRDRAAAHAAQARIRPGREGGLEESPRPG